MRCFWAFMVCQVEWHSNRKLINMYFLEFCLSVLLFCAGLVFIIVPLKEKSLDGMDIIALIIGLLAFAISLYIPINIFFNILQEIASK